MKKFLLLFFFLLFIFFSSPKLVFASIYFHDNFNDGDISDWTVVHNAQYGNPSEPCLLDVLPATWSPKEGGIGIQIHSPACVTEIIPNQFLVNGITEYIISFDTKLKGDFNSDRHFLIKYGDPNNWYNFKTYGTELNFQKLVGPTYNLLHNTYQFTNNGEYHFKIKVTNSLIELYINNQFVWAIPDSEPYINDGKVGFQASVGANQVTEVWFDNVMVCDINDPCGDPVTPTPTPISPTPIIPVVVIPGHGACFNHEAIIDGKENVPQENWKLLPFVHEYDGIINSIKNSDYQLDHNLYLFCYDWRKRIDQSADVLKDFILNKVLNGRSDVNEVKIVGHSLGGLVGRSFAQKYAGVNLERLITVGSPHQGVVQTYYAWEGGEPTGEKNLQWWAWKMLIQTQKRGFVTDVETIRNSAPSTQDLLPTFNFLKYSNGTEKDFRQMIWKNDWLFNLNNLLPDPPFLDKASALIGEKGDTPAWYKITNRNWLDQLLGKWDDGKPIAPEFENGDLTVLTKSGQLSGELPESLNLDHGDLVRKTEGITKIMELLNIPPISIEEGLKFKITPSLTFILGSPANINVTSPVGDIFEGGEDKIIFISEAIDGNYQVEILPSGSGNFRLIIGQETENNSQWNEIDGRVAGLPLTYQILFNSQKPNDSPIVDTTGKNYLALAREKIRLLEQDFSHPILDRILNEIDKCQSLIENGKNLLASREAEKIIEMVFKFRKDNSIPKARNLSFEAIELLSKVYEITANNSRESIKKKIIEIELKTTEKSIQVTQKLLQVLQKKGKLNTTNGVSFELANTQFFKAKSAYSENSFNRAKILLFLIQNLLKESLLIN